MSNTPKCKKENCQNPPAIKQVYCSRECAPLGNYCLQVQKGKQHGDGRALSNKKKVQDAASAGLTKKEAADLIGVTYSGIRYYAKEYKIAFKVGVRGHKKNNESDEV